MHPVILLTLSALLAACQNNRQPTTALMNPSQRIYATVILKAPSGRSVRNQSATAATIDSLRPDSSTTAAAMAYLTAAGFQIEQPGVTLSVSGPVSAFEKTFGMSLSSYQQNGETYYRTEKPPAVPEAARSFMETVVLAEPRQFFP